MKEQILKIVSNQKKHDKYSIAYMLNALTPFNYFYASEWKRSYILECLSKELDSEENIQKILKFNQFKHLSK